MYLNEIIQDINANFTPMAWERVKLTMIPYIEKKGYALPNFEGNVSIDEDMLLAIDHTLQDIYGMGLTDSKINLS